MHIMFYEQACKKSSGKGKDFLDNDAESYDHSRTKMQWFYHRKNRVYKGKNGFLGFSSDSSWPPNRHAHSWTEIIIHYLPTPGWSTGVVLNTQPQRNVAPIKDELCKYLLSETYEHIFFLFTCYVILYWSELFHFIILSCHQHGYLWPTLSTPPYRSSLPAGPLGYTPYPHRVAVCRFELITLLLLGHVKGSIGVHHL